MADDLPVMAFATEKAWETWLAKHHASTPGLWLKIAKKDTGVASVTYAEALDVALCHGWIDGQKGRSDDPDHWLQRFTPRRAKSRWSKINRDRAEGLIASGRMTQPGQVQVDAAKADGRWAAAYDGARTAAVPDDLRLALDASPVAKAFFDALDRTNRYAILYRTQDAKKPETRAARIATFVAMLERGEKLHPQTKA